MEAEILLIASGLFVLSVASGMLGLGVAFVPLARPVGLKALLLQSWLKPRTLPPLIPVPSRE